MNPYFSIIIPTYNHADFLKNSLSDVIYQTYSDWECIVIDNNSNDNTRNVVESFNDNRINFIEINNEGIIGKSRNLGIRKAKGTWIAFLDSDDRWYPNRLEVVYESIKKNNETVVFSTDEKVINCIKNSTAVNRYGPYSSNFYEKLLIYGNRLSTSATVVKKDFLEIKNIKFSEKKSHITVEDYDLWLKIAKENVIFKFIPVVCGEYILHGANASSKIELHFKNKKIMLFEHLNLHGNEKNKFYLFFLKKLISFRVDLAFGFAVFKSDEKFFGLKLITVLFIIKPIMYIFHLLKCLFYKNR